MNKKKSRTVSALLAVLLSAALLGGCGSGTNNGVQPASGVLSGGTATTVGINVCTGCHTVATSDWLTSKHANAVDGLDSAGSPTLGQIYTNGVLTNPVTVPVTCKNCHDPNGDSANIIAAGNIGSVARPVVGCEACHGGGSLHYGSGPISLLSGTYDPTALYTIGSATVSGQFLMCTNCHELLNTAGTGTNPSPAHFMVAPIGPQNYITDTHFAVAPVSYGTNTITGYAMDFASETVCADCHHPHKNADINKEWALSAHAVTRPSGAWTVDNWSTLPTCQRCHTTTGYAAYASALGSGNTALAKNILYGTLVTSPVPSTASWKPEMLECKGCHTDNRGALRNPGAYTADYSYSFYVTPPAVAKIYSKASFAYPDLAGSNVCMPCHTGRESGDTIKNLSSGPTPTTFDNLSFISSHHFPSGALMFRAAGYAYGGRDYSNITNYLHDKIGTTSAPNTGTNGPCIGCHMSRPNGVGNHLFMPTSEDELETTIAGIASEVCYQCHGPNDTVFLDMVTTQKGLYANAKAALQYLLEQRNYYLRGTNIYPLRDKTGTASITNGTAAVTGSGTTWTTSTTSGPPVAVGDYFRIDSDGTYYKIIAVGSDISLTLASSYTGTTATANYSIIQKTSIRNWLTQVGTGYVPALTTDTDLTGNTTGKNNMGAAANLYLFANEPGAYAHNRYYTKRLIYDSIDWMDDGVMNYSVGSTLSTICNGVTVTPQPSWCAGAISYLLPYGVLGISAERP
jgi:hypothetical protein